MRSPNIFHDPLHPLDTEKQTFGCRHTNSDICSKNGLAKVCALVRADKLCSAPPMSWPKQFQKLKQVKTKTK